MTINSCKSIASSVRKFDKVHFLWTHSGSLSLYFLLLGSELSHFVEASSTIINLIFWTCSSAILYELICVILYLCIWVISVPFGCRVASARWGRCFWWERCDEPGDGGNGPEFEELFDSHFWATLLGRSWISSNLIFVISGECLAGLEMRERTDLVELWKLEVQSFHKYSWHRIRQCSSQWTIEGERAQALISRAGRSRWAGDKSPC